MMISNHHQGLAIRRLRLPAPLRVGPDPQGMPNLAPENLRSSKPSATRQ
jgi:hypothetical protein